MAGVQRGGRPDCERITSSGASALQEFFNFLLLNNSALVRSADNILHCTLSDQLNPSDRCGGKRALILYHLLHSTVALVRLAWRAGDPGVWVFGSCSDDAVRPCDVIH